MKTKFFLPLFFSAVFSLHHCAQAQIPNCGPTVPVFYFDFTSFSTSTTLTASSVTRTGNCCSSVPPDICVLFVCTTGVNTIGLVFAMANCPLPPGSILYQVDCGPFILYGDTAFISTPGIHYLTYCKPGSIVCDFNVTAVIPAPTGIQNVVQPDVIIMPGFSSDYYLLSLTLPTSQTFTITIFSVDGRKVSERNYSVQSGHQQIPIYTENLPQGIYFCRVEGEKINKAFKFIK